MLDTVDEGFWELSRQLHLSLLLSVEGSALTFVVAVDAEERENSSTAATIRFTTTTAATAFSPLVASPV